jgi:uncharacterized protein (UPF0548 family)
MFLLSSPNETAVREFLAQRSKSSYSYPEVEATRNGTAPAGYNVDHNRQLLGHGHEVYQRAAEAVRAWKMFDMPWVRLCYTDTPIKTGQDVAIVISHFGFFSLNAARIVYLAESEPGKQRFGFAYGTLSEHGEIGEERFLVEFDEESAEVWYDLFAFSRPGAFLARLGYPLGRYLQKTFAADSKAAMLRAVSANAGGSPEDRSIGSE